MPNRTPERFLYDLILMAIRADVTVLSILVMALHWISIRPIPEAARPVISNVKLLVILILIILFFILEFVIFVKNWDILPRYGLPSRSPR